MDKKPITPEGQKKLREELDFIKNVKRQEKLMLFQKLELTVILKKMQSTMQLEKNKVLMRQE